MLRLLIMFSLWMPSDPCIIESLKHKCFLEELLFWTIKYEFPQKMVTFLLNMLPDQDYKVFFSSFANISYFLLFIIVVAPLALTYVICSWKLKVTPHFRLNIIPLFVLLDHFYKNICPALCIYYENTDEEPRVGHHVQPHCTYQRAAVQQWGVGSTCDRGVPAAGHHGHSPSLYDGELPY